ncbi:MAG: double-cubane-cluster-containing anaerobic reductase [Desulfobacterales bacterium]|nr:double-cubane-cluster-containing anaerobic reductase [Desulfobacterales bacterium]
MSSNAPTEPLMNDGLDSEPPAKRALQYVLQKKEEGWPVAGIYCGYAPIELMQAMKIVPALLCAFSRVPIESAEEVLPANLCPLIKSSYGFIREGTCPFFSAADVVVAETTCDGKKKMFELIAELRPLHVMDLPQMPEQNEAKAVWRQMIVRLKDFLERQTGRSATEEQIEEAISWSNRKNRLARKIFEYAALCPPVISWKEIYDISFLAMPSAGFDVIPLLEEKLEKLEKRKQAGRYFGTPDAPRVLVTGCPIGGDATKIFKVIEEAGGVVVAPDSCTGTKTFNNEIAENTGDPIGALAERYLKIPCACMTPNTGRMTALSKLIETYRPDVVVDFILQACHGYNVESRRIADHVKNHHGLPFLKVETDYSDADTGQLKTRIEALFETLPKAADAN